MDWELKETPKVGQRLARWIWFTTIALVLLAGLAWLTWRSIHRDQMLEQKKTGALHSSQPLKIDSTAPYFPVAGVSNGSTT